MCPGRRKNWISVSIPNDHRKIKMILHIKYIEKSKQFKFKRLIQCYSRYCLLKLSHPPRIWIHPRGPLSLAWFCFHVPCDDSVLPLIRQHLWSHLAFTWQERTIYIVISPLFFSHWTTSSIAVLIFTDTITAVGYKVVIYMIQKMLILIFCIIIELKTKLNHCHREVKNPLEMQLLLVLFISTFSLLDRGQDR